MLSTCFLRMLPSACESAARWMPIIMRIAYGTSASLPGWIRPYVWSSEATARTV